MISSRENPSSSFNVVNMHVSGQAILP